MGDLRLRSLGTKEFIHAVIHCADVLTNRYCFTISMRTPRLRRFLHLNFKKSNFEQPSWGTPRNRSALKSRFDKFAVVSGKIELPTSLGGANDNLSGIL